MKKKRKYSQNYINRSNKLKLLILSFLICIITIFTFAPSLKNGFVNWDDDVLVTNNLVIKKICWRNIETIFSSFFLHTYIPLTMLSFMVEHHFFQLNPFVFHLTNLSFHTFNALLVFRLFYQLSLKLPIAFLTALFFAIHPLRVESVTWISERKDVLYAFFFLWSVILYLQYRFTAKTHYYFLSIGVFLLSVLAKGSGVTLPFILILCDFLLSPKLHKGILIDKIPFFAIAFIFASIAFAAQKTFSQEPQAPSFSLFYRLFIASYVILFYLTKILIPVKLSCLYPYPSYPRSVTDAQTLPISFMLAPLFLVVLLLAIFFLRKYSPKILFGFLFFFISIFPFSQLIPITGSALAMDRYTYIPSLGISYLFAEGFIYLLNKYGRESKLKKILIVSLIGGIIGFWSILTWHRCQVWKDSYTLWNDTLSKYPNNPVARFNRASIYRLKGNYQQAIIDLSEAIRVDPEYTAAYNNRGIAYFAIGEREKSLQDFAQAIKLFPDYAEAYFNRSIVYTSMGNYENALSDLNQTLKLSPNDIEAYFRRANIYWMKGEFDKAWEDVKKIQKLGGVVDQQFYEKLKHDLGRQE